MDDFDWIKYLLFLFPLIVFLILYFRGKKVLKKTFPERDKSEIESKFEYCSIYLYKGKKVTRHYISKMAQVILFKNDLWITAYPIVSGEIEKGGDSMVHLVKYENISSVSIVQKDFLFGKKKGIRLIFEDNKKIFDYFITCGKTEKLFNTINSKIR